MTVSREMPKYQCHKQVWELKIKEIAHKPNPDTTGGSAAASYGAVITPADDGYSPFDVPAEFVTKHKPQAGGYFVVYDDGYKSFPFRYPGCPGLRGRLCRSRVCAARGG